MFAVLARILARPLVSGVLDVVKTWQTRKVSEAEMRAEVERAVLATLSQVAERQADVIIAEANAADKWVRRWRPVVAVSFAFIVVFYALILPIAVDWFGAPPVRIGDRLLGWVMQAVMLTLGGYIGGRTLEKVVARLNR